MSARELELVTKVLALIVMGLGMCFAAVSGILTSNIMTGGNPITPDLYGPEIYETPALVWTAMQERAAIAQIIGAMMVASQSRWLHIGMVLIVLGGCALAYLMGTLTYYAASAPQGIVIYAMCLGFGLPAALASVGMGIAIFVIERKTA